MSSVEPEKHRSETYECYIFIGRFILKDVVYYYKVFRYWSLTKPISPGILAAFSIGTK